MVAERHLHLSVSPPRLDRSRAVSAIRPLALHRRAQPLPLAVTRDELDDEPEDDGEDTGNAEDEALTGFMVLDGGPGCIIADGVPLDRNMATGEPMDGEDERPVSDPAAHRYHRDRIRRTRCNRIALRYPPSDGRAPFRYELRECRP